MLVAGAGAGVTDTSYGTIVETEVVDESALVLTAENTEAVVREYFADIPAMIQVARCESTFRHTLADGSVLRGHVDKRDTGVMQINTYYHQSRADQLELDLEDIYDNMAYARYLYEKQGLQPWSASQPCWGRTIAYNQ